MREHFPYVAYDREVKPYPLDWFDWLCLGTVGAATIVVAGTAAAVARQLLRRGRS